MDIALIVAGLAVYGWLLVLVHRRHVRKHLPWFAFYVLWNAVVACEQLVALLVSRQLYLALYWWVEAVGVLLIVAAVRESFLGIFRGFTETPWFRWLVSGVIVAVVAYSAWKAIYYPPVQGNRMTVWVVGAEFLFRWGVVGIAGLTIVMAWLEEDAAETPEDAVITGFGIASAAVSAATIWVSFFGTRYLFFSHYAPSVGYFMAAFLWIHFFSRPLEGIGFDDVGIGPEDMLKLARRWRRGVKRIRGK